MIQEDKQLLLVDLCARLPYGVKVTFVGYSEREDCILNNQHLNSTYAIEYLGLKPYLRSLSSITKNESAELSNIISEWFDKELFYLTEEPFLEYALSRINYFISPLLFDWLNKNMFDYRGLIPKDFAISTEEFNPYKKLRYDSTRID